MSPRRTIQLYPTFRKPASLPFVKEASSAKYGDYQFDMSTLISRHESTSTDKAPVSPDAVATAIIENFPKIPIIEKVACRPATLHQQA
jgi:hypothetical protein